MCFKCVFWGSEVESRPASPGGGGCQADKRDI